MDSHCTSPHWSIDTSLAALFVSLSRRIVRPSPDMLTVWLPAEAYVWVAWLVCVVTLPSPQSTV